MMLDSPCRFDGLSALLAGFSRAARERKLLAVLQAYVDDSTKTVGRRTLFLAGYVNTAQKWADLSEEWERVLQQGRPAAYMHMADAERMRGPFRGWGRLDRELKVLALARTIADSDPWSFSIAIDLRDFSDVFGPTVPYGFQQPYFLAFFAAQILVAGHHHNLGVTSTVDFIFDEQSQIHRTATALYSMLKEVQAPELRSLWGATPIFRSDKEVLPLQAADMLAWHVQRETRNGILIPRRRASDYLLRDGEHVFQHYGRAELTEMGEGVSSIGSGAPELSLKRIWGKYLSHLEGGQEK